MEEEKSIRFELINNSRIFIYDSSDKTITNLKFVVIDETTTPTNEKEHIIKFDTHKELLDGIVYLQKNIIQSSHTPPQPPQTNAKPL